MAEIIVHIPIPEFKNSKLKNVRWMTIELFSSSNPRQGIEIESVETTNIIHEVCHVLAVGRVIGARTFAKKVTGDVTNADLLESGKHWHAGVILADYIHQQGQENGMFEAIAIGELKFLSDENTNNSISIENIEFTCDKTIQTWIESKDFSEALSDKFKGGNIPPFFLPKSTSYKGGKNINAKVFSKTASLNIQKIYFPITNNDKLSYFVSYSNSDISKEYTECYPICLMPKVEHKVEIEEAASKYWEQLYRYQVPCYVQLVTTTKFSGNSYQLALSLLLRISVGLDFSTSHFVFATGVCDKHFRVCGVDSYKEKIEVINNILKVQEIPKDKVVILMPCDAQKGKELICRANEYKLDDRIRYIGTLPKYE